MLLLDFHSLECYRETYIASFLTCSTSIQDALSTNDILPDNRVAYVDELVKDQLGTYPHVGHELLVQRLLKEPRTDQVERPLVGIAETCSLWCRFFKACIDYHDEVYLLLICNNT